MTFASIDSKEKSSFSENFEQLMASECCMGKSIYNFTEIRFAKKANFI